MINTLEIPDRLRFIPILVRLVGIALLVVAAVHSYPPYDEFWQLVAMATAVYLAGFELERRWGWQMAYYFEPFTFPIPSTPVTDNTTDLGSTSLRFRDLYLSDAAIIGTTPATVGALRLDNNTNLQWRNAANTANSTGVYLNGGNNTTYDGVAGGLHDFQFAGTRAMSIGSNYIDVGASPALSGAVRLANAFSLSARDAPNTVDRSILGFTAGSVTTTFDNSQLLVQNLITRVADATGHLFANQRTWVTNQVTVHPTPIPHAHGCPAHPAGQLGVSAVSCRTDAAEHAAAWHAAIDPLTAQALTIGGAVDVPQATLATITPAPII